MTSVIEHNRYHIDFDALSEEEMDELFPMLPAIAIESAVVSPITGEVFFVDNYNRIVISVFYEIEHIPDGFIPDYITEFINELAQVPVVKDSNGNIYYWISLEGNESFLNANLFVPIMEIEAVTRINNNDLLYISIISTLIVSLLVCLFTIRKYKNKYKEILNFTREGDLMGVES